MPAHRMQVLGAALLFSTGGAAIKACTLSSWQVAGFRSGVAALVLLWWLRGGRRWWSPPSLAVGLAYAATMVLFVSANKLTTAANTIFLQSTAPLYVLLLAPWMLGETIRRSDLVFTACLVLGMSLFFVGLDAPLATSPDPFLGNVIAAVSGALWALTILGLRWLGRKPGSSPAEGAVVAGNFIAFAVCLPLAWPVQSSLPSDWLIIAFLGLFQIGLAYVCLTRGVRGLPALEVALLLLLEPVLNAIWAWLVHGERPGSWSLAGCAVILGSTLARALQRRS